jgi:hypothetical protein
MLESISVGQHSSRLANSKVEAIQVSAAGTNSHFCCYPVVLQLVVIRIFIIDSSHAHRLVEE